MGGGPTAIVTTDATTDPLFRARGLSAGRGLCFLEGEWNRVFSDPVAVFTSKDGRGMLRWSGGGSEPRDGDPFRHLSALLRARTDLTAAGYWSYDLRYHLERLPRLADDDLKVPDCWVALYRSASDECRVSNEGPTVPVRHPTLVTRTSPHPHTPTPTHPHTHTPLQHSIERPAYEAAVRRVLEYIAAGDCYQVNLSRRVSAPLSGSPWELYERLRRVSPAPYAAYLDCGDHQVLSSSPELFLRVQGGEAETRPIKGTRPRGASPEEDRALAAELLSSAKDRAELLMIVDLERNDLGRVCEYGSVRVPELFELESYSNVHHLVAAVRGRLRAEVDPLECLRALFPGGSITGAPKIRAMEIIEELEPVRRGVYTGAIGWVDGHGNGEWNIAIRTMVVKDGRVHFSTGGGIVADSNPAAEYAETVTKARGMLQALGQDGD